MEFIVWVNGFYDIVLTQEAAPAISYSYIEAYVFSPVFFPCNFYISLISSNSLDIIVSVSWEGEPPEKTPTDGNQPLRYSTGGLYSESRLSLR